MILSLFSSLYENKEISYTEQEWRDLFEQAVQFDLAPQLYYLIQQQNRADAIPAFVINGLKLKAVFTSIQNGWLKAETESVIEELSVRGIPVIALKGTRFAESYFGHFGARRTGDIDLLIPERYFERAGECLKDLGFSLTNHYYALHYHVEYSKQMSNTGAVVSVELHKSLLRKHRANIDIQRLWQEAEPIANGARGLQLTLQQTVYAICIHSSKHFMAQYRHVLDVAHLIYRYGDQIDFDRLCARAKKDGTFGMVTAALYAAYKLFPGLKNITPLPFFARRIPWYSEQTVLNAQQGVRGRKYHFHKFMYTLLTFDGPKPVYLFLKYFIFPPRDQMEKELQLQNQMPQSNQLLAKFYVQRIKKWVKGSETPASKKQH